MKRESVALSPEQFKRYGGMGHVFVPYRRLGGWIYQKVYVNPAKKEAFYWKDDV